MKFSAILLIAIVVSFSFIPANAISPQPPGRASSVTNVQVWQVYGDPNLHISWEHPSPEYMFYIITFSTNNEINYTNLGDEKTVSYPMQPDWQNGVELTIAVIAHYAKNSTLSPATEVVYTIGSTFASIHPPTNLQAVQNPDTDVVTLTWDNLNENYHELSYTIIVSYINEKYETVHGITDTNYDIQFGPANYDKEYRFTVTSKTSNVLPNGHIEFFESVPSEQISLMICGNTYVGGTWIGYTASC